MFKTPLAADLTRKINRQRGASSILLAVMLLSVLLVIGLGTSLMMLRQIKISGEAGRSVVAFYAADAGAERCLYRVRKRSVTRCTYNNVSLDFDSDARYTTRYNGSDQITSLGRYKGASRKVEIYW